MTHIYALGMSHKTANIAMREKIIAYEEILLAECREIMHAADALAMVWITTCNRTEIYVESYSIEYLQSWLADKLGLSVKHLQSHIYIYCDLDAIRHLMSVASGLDSMVLGEAEILGQIKTAYRRACVAGSINTTIARLFETTFQVAKKVRSQTEIGVNPVSVAYIAQRLAHKIFKRLDDKKVLLIGAGQTAQLMLKHLISAGVRKFAIANRSAENAQKLVQEHASTIEYELLGLANIPQVLASADIIIAATNAPLPLVGKGMAEQALKLRKYKAMLMIDLGVPRNIEPQVLQLADVFLYGIDDLESIAAKHQQTRSDAVPKATNIIEAEMAKFVEWLDMQNAARTIQSFRKRCEYTKDRTLEEAQLQLEQGKEPSLVLERFANTLLKRLLHEPTVQLRKASITGNNELLDMMREFFNT